MVTVEIQFHLLGPLDIVADGETVHVGGPRQRIVLAMLLLEANRTVPVERLIDAVWDEQPPATARSQVQIAISELRRRLPAPDGGDLILTRAAGYQIQLPATALDITMFHQLVADARDAVARGDQAGGVRQLRASLDLWRGDAAAGIGSRLVHAAALRLNEERLVVLEECLGIELELGRHQSVVAELRQAAAAHPLREGFHAQLMLALYRCGRQAEALAAYRWAHQLLVDEHGIDPSDRLRELERAILDNDPALDLDLPAAPAVTPIAPRQLPAALPDFVGRAPQVAQINSSATDAIMQVITGPGGVGKTALVLHAAHRMRDEFPDGQLFAHLRGSEVTPLSPEVVLDRFLRALGVPPTMFPTEPGELAALYRSRLAGQRILVVLDDAANAQQILPLVPSEPRCRLLVTSRSALPGLYGAERCQLDVFDSSTSAAMLTRMLGQERVAAEPTAVAELGEVCGHLPLAIRIAAAKLAVRPHWKISRMVSRLRDERRRLDELTLDGVGVRASISMSYQTLAPPARRLFSLLSLLGASDFADWVASPLLDAPPAEAVNVLDELVEAQLVTPTSEAAGQVRYRLHDLVNIFARETLAGQVSAAERAAAQQRLLRCWLLLARQAHRLCYGGDFTVLQSSAQPWRLPPEYVAEVLVEPLEWFESEKSNLVAAVRLAADLAQDELCWELAMVGVTLFESQADREAWHETHEVALRAVRQAGNQRGEAAICYSRGALAIMEQRLSDAEQDLNDALTWFAASGDIHGRGLARRNLAFIDRLQGKYDAAADRSVAALADLRQVRDRGGEAHVLSNLAQIYLERADHQRAQQLLRQALAICHDIGSARLEAQLRHRLGHLHLQESALTEAEEQFSLALTITTESGDQVGRAYALLGIGQVRAARHDWQEAQPLLQEALEAMRLTGHRLGSGQALVALAEVTMSKDPATAHTYLDEADELFAQMGAVVWRDHVSKLRASVPTDSAEPADR